MAKKKKPKTSPKKKLSDSIAREIALMKAKQAARWKEVLKIRDFNNS